MLKLLSCRAAANTINFIAAESWQNCNSYRSIACSYARLFPKHAERIPSPLHTGSTKARKKKPEVVNDTKLAAKRIPSALHTGSTKARKKKPEVVNETKLAATDPDVFGTIGEPTNVEYYIEEFADEGDAHDDARNRTIPFRSNQRPVRWYEQMMSKLIRDKLLKEAIDVLEIRMVQDRVRPRYYTYELLIIECGRVGHVKKAFQLFNRMKQRDLQVTGPVYAALFSACANCDEPKVGLDRAQNLRKQLIQNGTDINRIIYNNMIKAFGRCNDLQTAFELVDEMKDKRMELRIDSMNHLLQSCISDKEYGFRNALLVWHSIYRNRLTPDTNSFNFMMRCTRDCGIGDLPIAQQAIAKILSDSKSLTQIKRSREQLLIGDGNNSPATKALYDGTVASSEDTCNQTPNLISDLPHLGSLVQVNAIKTGTERLFLLGGMDAIITEMERLKVRPDVKTFSQLLSMMPATVEAESELIEKMRYMRVRADTDFFNILMRRRVERRQYESAKSVLLMMAKVNLNPDIATYGILAMSCGNLQEAKDFLSDLEEKNVRASIVIMGALMRAAIHNKDFEFAKYALEHCISEDITPNQRFCIMAADFINNSKTPSVDAKQFKRFYYTYKQWRQHFASGDIKEEPYWKQFKDSQQSGVEPMKNSYARRLWKRTHAMAKLNPSYLKRIHDKKSIKSEQKEPQCTLDRKD